MNIILTGEISSFRSLKEPGCWSFSIQTQEIPDQTALNLKSLHGGFVKIFITNNDISQEQVELVKNFPADVDEKYTPSQKMRFAIMGLAGREGIVEKEELEQFYRGKMEKYIDHINKQGI